MDNGASSYRRYLDGDDNGIVEIIRDYKDGLILFINRYVNNLCIAEELCEDTFFKLVSRKPRFSEKYSFKTWLYTIGRNTALNYLKRENTAELSDDVSARLSLEREYLRTEQRMAVNRAIKLLNPDYSQVLYLSFFEELKNDEIAHIMKKNKRQVENLIYRAKLALRSELNKEGFIYEEL